MGGRITRTRCVWCFTIGEIAVKLSAHTLYSRGDCLDAVALDYYMLDQAATFSFEKEIHTVLENRDCDYGSWIQTAEVEFVME